jgi:hypothetical protein
MSHRALIAIVLAGSACGPEITSFRPTDRTDPERAGPPSAAYDIRIAGQRVAHAHVWSTGGYVSSTDEPMAQVGFELENPGMLPVTFDGDTLELVVFDSGGTRLPPPRLTAIAPLGPSLIQVMPGKTALLAAYFLLPVRPRAVDRMQVRWTVRAGDGEYHQITPFVRDDDDAPFVERVRSPEVPPVRAPVPTESNLPRS